MKHLYHKAMARLEAPTETAAKGDLSEYEDKGVVALIQDKILKRKGKPNRNGIVEFTKPFDPGKVAKALMALGAKPQKKEWAPVSKKVSEETFGGDVPEGSYYLDMKLGDATYEVLISGNGKEISEV